MLKKLFLLVMVTTFALSSPCGCHWAGRTTGKVVKKTERAVEKITNAPKRFEKGYKEGRK